MTGQNLKSSEQLLDSLAGNAYNILGIIYTIDAINVPRNLANKANYAKSFH